MQEFDQDFADEGCPDDRGREIRSDYPARIRKLSALRWKSAVSQSSQAEISMNSSLRIKQREYDPLLESFALGACAVTAALRGGFSHAAAPCRLAGRTTSVRILKNDCGSNCTE